MSIKTNGQKLSIGVTMHNFEFKTYTDKIIQNNSSDTFSATTTNYLPGVLVFLKNKKHEYFLNTQYRNYLRIGTTELQDYKSGHKFSCQNFNIRLGVLNTIATQKVSFGYGLSASYNINIDSQFIRNYSNYYENNIIDNIAKASYFPNTHTLSIGPTLKCDVKFLKQISLGLMLIVNANYKLQKGLYQESEVYTNTVQAQENYSITNNYKLNLTNINTNYLYFIYAIYAF